MFMMHTGSRQLVLPSEDRRHRPRFACPEPPNAPEEQRLTESC